VHLVAIRRECRDNAKRTAKKQSKKPVTLHLDHVQHGWLPFLQEAKLVISLIISGVPDYHLEKISGVRYKEEKRKPGYRQKRRTAESVKHAVAETIVGNLWTCRKVKEHKFKSRGITVLFTALSQN
jgi:hypothetical protein